MAKEKHPEVARHFKVQHFVKELEALEGEKQEIADRIKSTFLQAEAHGLHKKALKALLKLRSESDDQKFQRKITELFLRDYSEDMQLELFDLWNPETDELTPVSVSVRLAGQDDLAARRAS